MATLSASPRGLRVSLATGEALVYSPGPSLILIDGAGREVMRLRAPTLRPMPTR